MIKQFGTISMLILVACHAPSSGVAQTQRVVPNILFLFADDQRADAIGAYGNPHVMTPALDALVARGFSFRSNYCMGSHHGAVCAPSRAMLMSGRGLFDVREDLEGVETLPMMLSDVGYQTFGTGKWHNGEAAFDGSFDSGRNVFFGGMCDHTSVLVRDKPLGGELTEKRDGGAFSSEIFADAAIEFISGERDPARPFFAYVSFSAPHDPRQPPERWREHYASEPPPLPPNFLPLHPFHNGWMNGRDEKLSAWPREPEVIQAQLGEYYGMISHLDEQVARILAALEETGEAQNTIIVYAADHGLALGSHGLLGKQSLYEHSMKCPLILAGPRVPRGSSLALTYLFDLVPTLAGLAGADAPDGLAGHDLLPVARGETPSVRDVLFTSYEDKMRAIRDERWKLIRYPRLDHTQLFDLKSDPHELVNLASSVEHAERCTAMLERLEAEQAASADPLPLTAETLDPMTYDPGDWERAPDRWQPEWIRAKYF